MEEVVEKLVSMRKSDSTEDVIKLTSPLMTEADTYYMWKPGFTLLVKIRVIVTQELMERACGPHRLAQI